MGQYAPELAHHTFAKHILNEAGKQKFALHDALASEVMDSFDKLPASREASLAKMKLEEAIFWANRSIVTSPEYQE